MCIFDRFPNKDLQKLIKAKEGQKKATPEANKQASNQRMHETYRSEPGFCG